MPEYLDGEHGRYEVGPMLAYQGREGCEDWRCTRLNNGPGQPLGPCIGWHCPHCHQPCSMMGHRNCPALDPRVVI